MPDQDLNKMLSDVQKKSADVKRYLLDLLGTYDDFYRASNHSFMQERAAAKSMDGFEDFYRMVQSIRRNRDVISSMVRGIASLRTLAEFKVIEEDVPEPKQKTTPQPAQPQPAVPAAPRDDLGRFAVAPESVIGQELAETVGGTNA